MSSLELAIRRALEKAGPGADATQRARVYQSARNALENGLRQQKISDANLISEQRRQLEAIINVVERDARLDFMEYEAKQRAAREEAEREEQQRLDAERAEEERLEAEAARAQAERDAELRRRREEIDRERAAREAEYEAAQRALRERIAAREQAQREQAARERERQEEEARREAQQEREAEEKAEREALAREQAVRDQAEREERLREQAAREEAERERRRQAEIARAEGERRRQEVERAAREEEARQNAARQAERERLERERAERERAENEQAERQRAEQERAAQEQAARLAAEREAAERQRRTEDEARRLEAELASVELDDAGEPEAPVQPSAAAPLIMPADTVRAETRFSDAPSFETDSASSVEPDRQSDDREPVFDIMPEVEPRESRRGDRQAPVFDIEAPEPAYSASEAPAAAAMDIQTPPERAVKPRKRRRWKAKAFALVTLIAFAGAGWWWVESTGLMLPKSVRDGSVPNPPPTVQDEDFDGAKQLKSLSRQGGYGEEWTKLFDAGQTPRADAGPQATVKPANGGSGPYLDITSKSPEVDGSVAIELPQSIIASLQGKKSSISLTIQGGDKPVQVAVECEFGGLGNCGRHRFLLERNKTDLMFDVTVKADGSADGPGRLLINADAGGEGNSVKLYSVHVLPGG